MKKLKLVQHLVEKVRERWGGVAATQVLLLVDWTARVKRSKFKNANWRDVQVYCKFSCTSWSKLSLFIVNGGWSDFEVSAPCSATCGPGHETLKRYCNNPSPTLGGLDCVGEPLSTRTCELKKCPGYFFIVVTSIVLTREACHFSPWKLVRVCSGSGVLCHLWEWDGLA